MSRLSKIDLTDKKLKNLKDLEMFVLKCELFIKNHEFGYSVETEDGYKVIYTNSGWYMAGAPTIYDMENDITILNLPTFITDISIMLLNTINNLKIVGSKNINSVLETCLNLKGCNYIDFSDFKGVINLNFDLSNYSGNLEKYKVINLTCLDKVEFEVQDLSSTRYMSYRERCCSTVVITKNKELERLIKNDNCFVNYKILRDILTLTYRGDIVGTRLVYSDGIYDTERLLKVSTGTVELIKNGDCLVSEWELKTGKFIKTIDNGRLVKELGYILV